MLPPPRLEPKSVFFCSEACLNCIPPEPLEHTAPVQMLQTVSNKDPALTCRGRLLWGTLIKGWRSWQKLSCEWPKASWEVTGINQNFGWERPVPEKRKREKIPAFDYPQITVIVEKSHFSTLLSFLYLIPNSLFSLLPEQVRARLTWPQWQIWTEYIVTVSPES